MAAQHRPFFRKERRQRSGGKVYGSYNGRRLFSCHCVCAIGPSAKSEEGPGWISSCRTRGWLCIVRPAPLRNDPRIHHHPSFNQASFLERTILSVLEQDYPELNICVVDGGSTDGSLEIIKKYANRLAWWVSEKDQGQAEAINKGFAHAHGEIMAWLNSDDYYLPGAVSAAVKEFERHPQAVMIYGNMLAVDESDRPINTLKYHQLSLVDLLCFQIIGQPAVFMRRSAFEKAGGLDVTLHFLLDHQLWIRLAEQGEIVHVNETWAAARYHAGAKNRAQAVGFSREAFRVLDWASKEPSLAPALAQAGRRAPGLCTALQRPLSAGRWTAKGCAAGLDAGAVPSSPHRPGAPEFGRCGLTRCVRPRARKGSYSGTQECAIEQVSSKGTLMQSVCKTLVSRSAAPFSLRRANAIHEFPRK